MGRVGTASWILPIDKAQQKYLAPSFGFAVLQNTLLGSTSRISLRMFCSKEIPSVYRSFLRCLVERSSERQLINKKGNRLSGSKWKKRQIVPSEQCRPLEITSSGMVTAKGRPMAPRSSRNKDNDHVPCCLSVYDSKSRAEWGLPPKLSVVAEYQSDTCSFVFRAGSSQKGVASLSSQLPQQQLAVSQLEADHIFSFVCGHWRFASDTQPSYGGEGR